MFDLRLFHRSVIKLICQGVPGTPSALKACRRECGGTFDELLMSLMAPQLDHTIPVVIVPVSLWSVQ